ncbi:hypothetical protein ACSHWG_02490 [Leucobacter sp. Z1108]|uniref:hypothetical protein n=1 Tax=Leucobacter sp. Z1108 TaxID=3439066 RepID=UPI003F3DD5E3
MSEEVTEEVTDEVVDQGEDDTSTSAETDDETIETFPRDYVVKLRDENAKYRQRAADRDEVAARLHAALVAATGRLQDPTDLAFDEAHLSDPEALADALEALLQAKPHLANRRPAGNIGQGVSVAPDSFSLSGLLKANAS